MIKNRVQQAGKQKASLPINLYAEVAESADALDSGSSECKFMRVQVPSSAPKESDNLQVTALFLCIGLEPSIYRGPRKVGDFLGRGGTYKVIVVPLLATVFNHGECSDESPFFKTKKAYSNEQVFFCATIWYALILYYYSKITPM